MKILRTRVALQKPTRFATLPELFQALGWKISDPWNMNYWPVETKDGDTGINGGLMPCQNPGQPFMNYIQVDSIDDALAKVTAAAGTVALPKTEIGQGMGFIAAFKDTEGNLLGFHSPQRNPPDRHQIGCPTSGFSDVGKNFPHIGCHPEARLLNRCHPERSSLRRAKSKDLLFSTP